MRAAALAVGGASSTTPLCPSGHLPLKGGDYALGLPRLQSPTLNAWEQHRGQPTLTLNWMEQRYGRLISPLEGEMSGRTEGGR